MLKMVLVTFSGGALLLAALCAFLSVLAGVLLGSAPPSPAIETSNLSRAVVPLQIRQQVVGAGKWQSRREATKIQGWQIQLQRMTDDSLVGRITIVGSPLIQQARIEGQISGSDVYGVLVGDNDIQVVTFTGSLFKGSMSGTYTTSDGDSGNWSWEGVGGIESSGDRAIGPLKSVVSSASDVPADVGVQPATAWEITALGLEAPGLQSPHDSMAH